MPTKYKFNTFHAWGQMGKLLDFLVTKGEDGATKEEIAEALHWLPYRVGYYLRHMSQDEQSMVHRLPRPKRVGNRTGLAPVKWAAGPSPAQLEKQKQEEVPERVRLPYESATATFQVDPLMAGLFGRKKS